MARAAAFDADSVPTSAARIIYTAGTLGHVQPCRTCGSAQGGLARRAALLRNLAVGRHNPLIIAGPGEFYADRAEQNPQEAKKRNPALVAAFERMPYAAIYLSQAVVRDMREQNLALPAKGIPIVDKPVTEFFRAGSLSVACVFLPKGISKGSPSPDQLTAAKLAALEASASAELLIAVSPWGMKAENAIAQSLGGYFHILLGGGKGIAVPGQATGDSAAPGPLWLRGDRLGRAVNVLDILSLPAFGSPWLDGVNFTSSFVFLDPDLPEDESIRELVRDFKDVD